MLIHSAFMMNVQVVVTVTASSDRFHILPAQIDRHKQVCQFVSAVLKVMIRV
jgi:hypothetical protein